MIDHPDEPPLTVYDVLDHFWAWRWFMVVAAIIAVAASLYTARQTIQNTPIMEDSVFVKVYLGGTPLGNMDVTRHQLADFLDDHGHEAQVQSGGVVVAPSASLENDILAFEALLDETVSRLVQQLREQQLQRSETDTNRFLVAAEPYLAARRAGLIKLFSIENTQPGLPPTRQDLHMSKTVGIGVVVMILASALTFILSVLRKWWSDRQKRKTRTPQ